MADEKWFGRGFVPGSYTPPVETSQGDPQDVYNRNRFFLRPEEEREIVFLDGLEDGYRYVEHSACDLDHNKRPTFFPCLQLVGKPCWLCEKECPKKRVMAISAIDITGYEFKTGEKKGTRVKNVKRLFVIPEKNLGLFVRKSKAVNGLKAYKFKVFRSNKQASNLGDDYTPIGRVTKEWVTEEKIDTKAYEYDKLVPFETSTAEGHKKFFEDNPSIVWGQNERRGGAPAGAAAGAAAGTAAADNAEADAAASSSQQPTGDDIPF